MIYLVFLAKVANLYYMIMTALKKYWPDTVAKFISGTQDTFAWQRVRAKAQHFKRFPSSLLKVGFSQKVMVKFSNLSNCHSCEPKIVPALLIPVNDINKILAIL